MGHNISRQTRLRETRRKLKVMMREHAHQATVRGFASRGSSVNASIRQSMLDVSIRSTQDEHSAFVTAAQVRSKGITKVKRHY